LKQHFERDNKGIKNQLKRKYEHQQISNSH